MKKLLLLLLIFVGVNSYGQNLPISPVNLQAINGPTCLRGIDPEIMYDTVKVELLISDTSHWFETTYSFISHKEAGCKDSTKSDYHYLVGHVRVTERDGGRKNSLVHSVPGYIRGVRNPFGIDMYNWETYLDHNKKPFKKDIIVHSYVIVK